MPHHANVQWTNKEADCDEEIRALFEQHVGNPTYRNAPFLFARRQSITESFAFYELYKKIIERHGAIVECGVYQGNNFVMLNQLAAMFEPYNLAREIIGFDSFEGFTAISANDAKDVHNSDFSDTSDVLLRNLIAAHDKNRPVGHVPRAQLVKGDACETIPHFVAQNPHLMIALLILDFDLYAPTKAALTHLLPLVVKGGVVAFDELAMAKWKGETIAFKEFLSCNDVKLERFPFHHTLSYFTL
jgi:hypothetical protein